MIKILSVLLSVILMVPAPAGAAKAAPAGTEGVFVAGKFLSVAGAPDGSAYLLGADHRVVRVRPDGSQSVIALPKIAEAKPGDRFCDLVTDGRTLAFCGFAFPVVFELNLKNPRQFTTFRPPDQEAASLHLLNISREADGWRLRDADGYVFRFRRDQPLQRLPRHAALEAGPQGATLLIPPPDPDKPRKRSGLVTKEDGSPFWAAPTPAAPRQVKSVEFLGYDADQRSVFSVITGSGELDTVFTLYAVRGGRIDASREIPGPAGLTMQRPCRLAPDGTILLVQAAGENGVLLQRVRLEGKK
ncbi:MAG: hypothetical protein GX442_21165 [Candidatus Riflebacteria bacterium]|nr:hypothetical protein [Candidatus Riflebacteria bacterium]